MTLTMWWKSAAFFSTHVGTLIMGYSTEIKFTEVKMGDKYTKENYNMTISICRLLHAVQWWILNSLETALNQCVLTFPTHID